MTKVETHVLHFFGFTEGTYRAGSFIRSLIDAIMRADTPNTVKLYLGFPEYVDAVRAYQTGCNMAGEKVDIFADYEGER